MTQEELKNKKITELYEIAESLGIPDYREKRKPGLIMAILEAEARQRATEGNEGGVQVDGVLEILEDGFGFLRSPEYSYLPSSDDIYVSPSQ
ncbi:MAG: Rho termination factor N-terminal domain-containing protein, partial [candidate division WOR-3 bacterium]